jgi:hypothetical protein
VNAPSEVLIYEAQLVEFDGRIYQAVRIDIPGAPYRERSRTWFFDLDETEKSIEAWVRERYHPNDLTWQMKLPF